MTGRAWSFLYLSAGLVIPTVLIGLGQPDKATRGTILVFFVIVPIFFSAFGYLAVLNRRRASYPLSILSPLGACLYLASAMLVLRHPIAVSMAVNVTATLASATVLIVSFFQGKRGSVSAWFAVAMTMWILPSFLLLDFAAIHQLILGAAYPAILPAVHPLPISFPYHLIWFMGHPECVIFLLFLASIMTELAFRIRAYLSSR